MLAVSVAARAIDRAEAVHASRDRRIPGRLPGRNACGRDLGGARGDPTSSANLVPLNTADNWLHHLLAVGMIALGMLLVGVQGVQPE